MKKESEKRMYLIWFLCGVALGGSAAFLLYCLTAAGNEKRADADRARDEREIKNINGR